MFWNASWWLFNYFLGGLGRCLGRCLGGLLGVSWGVLGGCWTATMCMINLHIRDNDASKLSVRRDTDKKKEAASKGTL